MATVLHEELLASEGFRVESPLGMLGWVEEVWLGPAGEPAALAVRTIDGRDGLLLAEDVEMAMRENQLVLMRGDGRLLELDVPRLERPADGSTALTASWQTTGEVLEPPSPPGMFRHALLALRPWRLAPPPQPGAEKPLWQLVAALYTALAVIVILVIVLAFVVAKLVAGNAV